MLGEKTLSGGLWKAKVGDRWEGKRNLCSQPSSVQLDWNLLSSTKTSLWKNGMIFFFRTNVPNICFSCPIQKMILFGVLRKAKFPQHIRLKSSKWIIWGGMTGRGLTGIHFLPQGQTLTADYYINNILEKELKPVLHRKNVNEATDKWKLFSSNRHMTFVQDGTPAHAAKATQAWCKKNLPNFIEKTCWPPNSPDINPVENLWSIMDEVVYKDPTPKTMKDLKRRLKQAWKKIPLSTLHDLSHSMPQRLRNVITNKGGHAGYWLFEYMYSVKQ